MAKGKIVFWKEEKGFGFIQPEGTAAREDQVFCHIRDVAEIPRDQLRAGTMVEFTLVAGKQGKSAAKNVHLVGVSNSPAATAPQKPEAKKEGADELSRPYRFLNPYNFVRFLSPVDSAKELVKATGPMAEKLMALGLNNMPQQEIPVTARKLLGKCTPPPHDRYIGIAGKIVCSLEAVTPLFVSDSENVEPREEHKSYEFFKMNGEYTLPGSSLRGMVRSVFEAATNSCMSKLSAARLSYHLPPVDALQLVPAQVEQKNGNWNLRLLTGTTPLSVGRRPNGPQYAAWVPRYLSAMLQRSRNIPGPPSYGTRKDVALGGRSHKTKCWALLKLIKHPRNRFDFWNVEQIADTQQQLRSPQSGELQAEGFLCITNQNIENKHDERFFFHGSGLPRAATVPLDQGVINDYRVLIRDYQQRHHEHVERRRNHGKDPEKPDGKEPGFSRFIVHEHKAELSDGDLVYVMLKNMNQAEFIVPVSIPRVAYKNGIKNLLPDKTLTSCNDHRNLCLCPACRVFGWVYQAEDGEVIDSKKRMAYAGRVRFTHGTLVRSSGTLPATPLAILSSPKPTTIRFYLQPQNGDIPEKWTGEGVKQGYDRENFLRGRKFYRHHQKVSEESYYRVGGRCDDQNRTVRDALLPGARFSFTVYFENLAPLELGALLWALEMDNKCLHRLGYAKPLGFGSVKVKIDELAVLSPEIRYSSLDNSGWKPVRNWQTEYVEKFQTMLTRYYKSSDFESLPNIQDIRAVLGESTRDLPIHYPRTNRLPDPEGKNFEWFMGNNRYVGYALGPATDDKGLSLVARDGTEIP